MYSAAFLSRIFRCRGANAYGQSMAIVMNVMGTDVRTSMRYQHPALDSVREAIDQRNLRHDEVRVQ